MVDLNIEEQIQTSVKSSIENYLKSVDLDNLIAENLQKTIGVVLGNLTNKVLGAMLKDRDLPVEVNNIVNNLLKDHVKELGTKAVVEVVKQADLNKVILSCVQSEVHRVAGSYNFPEASIPWSSINFDGHTIPADKINDSIIPNLKSTGINDSSTKNQLTITDEGVIVHDNITSENLLVADHTFLNHAVVEGSLTLSGQIQHSDSLNDYIAKVANGVIISKLSEVNSSDIDLSNRKLVANDRVIVSDNTLGPQITNSNLRKVGNLTELTVSGQVLLGETLVVNNNQVGINTEEPRGALTVWDEDSEVSFLKVAPKRMFAGSTRVTDISFGTNSIEQLIMHSTGELEIIGKLNFNGIIFGVEDKIPERVGQYNEIVLVRNGGGIFTCIGQNSWKKIA